MSKTSEMRKRLLVLNKAVKHITRKDIAYLSVRYLTHMAWIMVGLAMGLRIFRSTKP